MRELCNHPTTNGPCTMRKGHIAAFHRHVPHDRISWKIYEFGRVGVPAGLLEEGEDKVPLYNSITRLFENYDRFTVALTIARNAPGGSLSDRSGDPSASAASRP